MQVREIQWWIGIVGDMRENGQKMDSFLFTSLVHGLCESCNIDGAEKVFQEMVHCGISSDTVTYKAIMEL